MTKDTHTWRFFTAGGFDQVRLDRGADLAHLAELDQKLWVALSCPVQGVEFDRQTLALIDRDQDGHIRAQELIEAIDWALARLKSPETLINGGPLQLSEINDATPEGATLLASARHILNGAGQSSAAAISVADSHDRQHILAGMAANGNGIITPQTQTDSVVQQAVTDILSVLPGCEDQSGVQGIDQAILERFREEAQQWLNWLAEGDQVRALDDPDRNAAAFAAFSAVSVKVEDYFTRCQLAAFDPCAGQLLNAGEARYQALAGDLLSTATPSVTELPLAFVDAQGRLPLGQGINPAWQAAITRFATDTVAPVLGPCDHLDQTQWLRLQQVFAGHAAWLQRRPETPVATLAADRLRALLDADLSKRLQAAIAADLALADEAAAIADVDRLVRYVRDLSTLANNMVSFRDFYSRQGTDQRAIFQAGTLYLDGRSCQLCIKVLDPARHATLAGLSGVYLAYCDCQRGSEKMTIAAAFTAGDSDQLMAGRNGIFYDREGRDWEATITRIVEHPISIRQAFWAPYKKAARLIGEQLQKFAAARAKAVEEMTTQAIQQTAKKAETAKPATPPPAPVDAARFAGIFAAIGLAVGAIGTAVASVITGFLGLKFWQMPLAAGGLVLLVSGPSIALAYFKLRNRNLGPILDANGWAVNARARINIPFGTALTHLARLPEGANRALGDPYAEKKTPWKRLLLVMTLFAVTALGLAWHFGKL